MQNEQQLDEQQFQRPVVPEIIEVRISCLVPSTLLYIMPRCLTKFQPIIGPVVQCKGHSMFTVLNSQISDLVHKICIQMVTELTPISLPLCLALDGNFRPLNMLSIS